MSGIRWRGAAALAMALLVLGGCATPPAPMATPDEFRLEVREDLDARRFALALVSTSSDPLCFDADAWPNEAGNFRLVVADIRLVVDGRSLEARGALMSAYCPGGCGVARLSAGETRRGMLAFSAFGDAEAIARAGSRELVYPLALRHCR